jgi:hypothetical protein
VRAFVDGPDDGLLDHNQAVAREHFSEARVARDLERLLQSARWLP